MGSAKRCAAGGFEGFGAPITQTAVMPSRSLKSLASGSTAAELTLPLAWKGVKGAAITRKSGSFVPDGLPTRGVLRVIRTIRII